MDRYASPAGRFAPSPTGDLHVGNLRTALLSWLFARSSNRNIYLRIEDLDRVRSGSESRQLRDLELIGFTWDGPPLRQSENLCPYRLAVTQLKEQDLLYECYCSRKEIAETIAASASAPNSPELSLYPGTCRDLSDGERERRRRLLADAHRAPALRLRSMTPSYTVQDQMHGQYTGAVDDFVILRNDGAFAYNLVCVVDDARMNIDQVVRADDLLPSAPRQAYLASLLAFPTPQYAHVPLALNTQGSRLAKRDGAVTLEDLGCLDPDVGPRRLKETRAMILTSLGLPPTLEAALECFEPNLLPREPWIFPETNPHDSVTTRLSDGTGRVFL